MKCKKTIVLILTVLILSGLGLVKHNGICIGNIEEVQAASYDDYRYWSQGASDIPGVRKYGCWIVAQSKMIYEANIDRDSTFNPDVYYYWEVKNGYVNSNIYQLNGAYAPVAYANQKGKNLYYHGFLAATDEQLWKNINAGYYTIVRVSTSPGKYHYVMVANDISKEKGTIYVYDSTSVTTSEAPKALSIYPTRYGGYVYSLNAPVEVIPNGISLNQTSITFNSKGEYATLTATVYPSNATNKNVTWVSSDTSVATVSSSGVVNSVGIGTATITAKTASGGKIACCTVMVKQSLKNIILSDEKIELIIGDEKDLTVKYDPEDTTDARDLIWSSDNEEVVTVDNGKIVAAGIGNAVVTAVCNNISASCQVSVDYADELFSLNEEIMLMGGGTQNTLELLYDSEPFANYVDISWESSDDNIAKVSDNGTVTALKKGIITVTVLSDEGIELATCKIYVIREEVPKEDELMPDEGAQDNELSTGENTMTDSEKREENNFFGYIWLVVFACSAGVLGIFVVKKALS